MNRMDKKDKKKLEKRSTTNNNKDVIKDFVLN